MYFLLCCRRRFAPCEMKKLASALSKVGWKFSSLVDTHEIEMYNRLKESQAGGDDDALLDMLQKRYDAQTQHYSTIDSAFSGETLDEEDVQVLGGKYSHVIQAASAFAILEDDGSNAQTIFEDIDIIFTTKEEGDTSHDHTKDDRWKAFEKRCVQKGWTKKFGLLKRIKGEVKIAANVAKKAKVNGSTGESSRSIVANMQPTAKPSWATL